MKVSLVPQATKKKSKLLLVSILTAKMSAVMISRLIHVCIYKNNIAFLKTFEYYAFQGYCDKT